MRIDEHIAALRREGELMAEAIAGSDLDQIVPTCPEWTVRDLSQHLGRVHRWAATYVGEARTEEMTEEQNDRAWGEPPADSDIVAWFRDGHRNLVDVLAAAPPDLACWSFLPAPSPLAFWARRQAHETAIHRADAESARGAVSAVAADFAVDGIDELLVAFFSRPRNRVRNETPRTLAITATDAEASWLIHIGPEGARPERVLGADQAADGGVRGPANDLYLGLWNRGALDLLEVSGDAALVELWRASARVRWI